MTPERWRQVEQIYQAALDRDMSERSAFLDQACAHDPELRSEIDIFAVGAVLYEMLAGRRPFLGDTSAETMTAIVKHDPPPIRGISTQVEQIVRHCLEELHAAHLRFEPHNRSGVVT
jgi:serine/threonine protein kinase